MEMNFIDTCKSIYKDSKQLFEKKDAALFFTHFGELSSEIISDYTIKTEEYLIEIGAAKRTVKSIFNILIEGLQNIVNHGENSPKGEQVGYFNIGELKNHFILSFSNLIHTSNLETIEKAIKRLNDADESGLKVIYLDTLSNGQISAKGGAGLGIITMAMKSKNKINHQSMPVNKELSLITIEVRIDKI